MAVTHSIGAVALGGALGSLARHGVNIGVAHFLGGQVPYATAGVNVLGSGVIGLLAGLIASGRLAMSVELRTFVFVGLLGGFTTFSSLMLDTLTLNHTGERALAVWNLAGQTMVGFMAVYLGYYLGAR